jgi:hypothetical protein
MVGKFNLGYFFKGAGVEDWWKALGHGWRLLVIIALCFVVFKGIMTFFPTQKQTQTNTITAQAGSTVNIGQSQSSVKARPWWLPHLFTELYAFAESDSRTGVGTRGGLQWIW